MAGAWDGNGGAELGGLTFLRPTRSPAKRPAAKGERSAKPKAKPKPSLTLLDATIQLLEEATEPLSCAQITEAIIAKGWWQTQGRTPAATLYAAIIREIRNKGDRARFMKTGRGRFALAR
ncbi:MAG: winged helix-turn-helix domain-containing protein [Planctomycetota bacterium]|nr:winged helix-turn-helix domain-containing protein [Planctomycetota bacterium]